MHDPHLHVLKNERYLVRFFVEDPANLLLKQLAHFADQDPYIWPVVAYFVSL